MKKKMVTEIVNFEIDPNLAEADFIDIVHSVEELFHKNQSGYVDSELLKGKGNSWAMLMHWESMEEVKQASKLMMQDALTAEFRQAIIPTSVKMSYLWQLKCWKK